MLKYVNKERKCRNGSCRCAYIPENARDQYCSEYCKIFDLIKEGKDSQCHHWQGPKTDFGKPRLSLKGKIILVQNWVFFNGDIPKNKPIIRPNCGYEGCVNKDHLIHTGDKG